jgi:hypothetical protein
MFASKVFIDQHLGLMNDTSEKTITGQQSRVPIHHQHES